MISSYTALPVQINKMKSILSGVKTPNFYVVLRNFSKRQELSYQVNACNLPQAVVDRINDQPGFAFYV